MLRILEYYFFIPPILNVSLVKIKNQRPKNKRKTKTKHKMHLCSSDPDHVVKREGSLSMSIQEKTN